TPIHSRSLAHRRRDEAPCQTQRLVGEEHARQPTRRRMSARWSCWRCSRRTFDDMGGPLTLLEAAIQVARRDIQEERKRLSEMRKALPVPWCFPLAGWRPTPRPWLPAHWQRVRYALETSGQGRSGCTTIVGVLDGCRPAGGLRIGRSHGRKAKRRPL